MWAISWCRRKAQLQFLVACGLPQKRATCWCQPGCAIPRCRVLFQIFLALVHRSRAEFRALYRAVVQDLLPQTPPQISHVWVHRFRAEFRALYRADGGARRPVRRKLQACTIA